MVEWSITTVLKTVVLRGTGGSNPSLSADKSAQLIGFQYVTQIFYFSVTQNQTQISSKTRRILKIAIPKLSKEMLKYVSDKQIGCLYF